MAAVSEYGEKSKNWGQRLNLRGRDLADCYNDVLTLMCSEVGGFGNRRLPWPDLHVRELPWVPC